MALKTGAIDAQDNPTNMTRDWKFHEVTKQVVLTKHLVQPVFLARRAGHARCVACHAYNNSALKLQALDKGAVLAPRAAPPRVR